MKKQLLKHRDNTIRTFIKVLYDLTDSPINIKEQYIVFISSFLAVSDLDLTIVNFRSVHENINRIMNTDIPGVINKVKIKNALHGIDTIIENSTFLITAQPLYNMVKDVISNNIITDVKTLLQSLMPTEPIENKNKIIKQLDEIKTYYEGLKIGGGFFIFDDNDDLLAILAKTIIAIPFIPILILMMIGDIELY